MAFGMVVVELLVVVIIIAIIGVASISNYMFSNVYERRREIGIYMAMGSKPSWIVQVFMLKALYIGLIGGVLGYLIGSADNQHGDPDRYSNPHGHTDANRNPGANQHADTDPTGRAVHPNPDAA